AHAFLREVPRLEEAGGVVCVPNWGNAERAPRPRGRGGGGSEAPSNPRADALLDFQGARRLVGGRLPRPESEELRQSTGALAPFQGRGGEIDRERLGAVLAHWTTAEKAAARDGLSFLEGMRLLAGVRDDDEAESADPERAWTRVEAGPWLAAALDGLRSPEGL